MIGRTGFFDGLNNLFSYICELVCLGRRYPGEMKATRLNAYMFQ
jgi:hypothetical protein